MRKIFAILIVLTFGSVSNAAEDLTPEAAFENGTKLLSEQKYQEAIEQFETALVAFPNNPAVLWNLGIATSELSQDQKAIKYWGRYQKANPEDWRAHAKLIQTHQALEDNKSRDHIREELFTLRESQENSDLNEAKRYCREQLQVEGRNVLVFEYFEPLKNKWAVFFSFIAIDDDGKQAYRVSMGSYDWTNQIEKELGNLKEGERLYHLDGYFQKENHVTYGFLQGAKAPSYDEIRPSVLKIIADVEKSGNE